MANGTGRAGMRKRSKENWRERPRTVVPAALFDSYAWAAISPAARQAFLRLVIEHARHAGAENGSLKCTYMDFEKFGITPRLIARSIRELVAVGLIEVTCKGLAGPAEHRNAALYLLTYGPDAKGRAIEGKHTYEQIKTREEADVKVRLVSNPVSVRDIANGHKAASAKKKIPPTESQATPPAEREAKTPNSRLTFGRRQAPKAA